MEFSMNPLFVEQALLSYWNQRERDTANCWSILSQLARGQTFCRNGRDITADVRASTLRGFGLGMALLKAR